MIIFFNIHVPDNDQRGREIGSCDRRHWPWREDCSPSSLCKNTHWPSVQQQKLRRYVYTIWSQLYRKEKKNENMFANTVFLTSPTLFNNLSFKPMCAYITFSTSLVAVYYLNNNLHIEISYPIPFFIRIECGWSGEALQLPALQRSRKVARENSPAEGKPRQIPWFLRHTGRRHTKR